MEFSNVGKHCYICKQQDFLPFFCNFCEQYYCLKHRNHDCNIPVENIPKKSKTKNLNRCQQCRKKVLVPIICQTCQRKSCISHRFHDCNTKNTPHTNIGNIKNNIIPKHHSFEEERSCCTIL